MTKEQSATHKVKTLHAQERSHINSDMDVQHIRKNYIFLQVHKVPERTLIMEMCYDGTLVMPKNFVAVAEEEMTYVEGGWYLKSYGIYSDLYLSHQEVIYLRGAQGFVGGFFGGIPFAITTATQALFGSYDKGYGIKLEYIGSKVTKIKSLSKSEARLTAYNKLKVTW